MSKAKFDVYYNLHKKLFSVKVRSTGLVDRHSHEVRMSNVTFKVSEKGRQRVLKEQRKNVHAYVRGDIEETHEPFNAIDWTELTYNPYKYKHFVRKDTGESIFEATQVHLINKKIFARLG